MVGLKIGPDPRKDITVKEFRSKAAEFKDIPEISGLELRFKGNIDSHGNITAGPTLKQIEEVCDYARNFDLLNLHLSEYSLNIITGQYKGRKLDDSLSFLDDNFDLIIGHYGEHDNLFGQATTDSYAKILKGTRFSSKKVFWSSLSTILEDGEILPSMQKKFLIENGTKAHNCLPRVYEYAKSHNLGMTLDIGHVIAGILEVDPDTQTHYDNIHQYVVRGRGGKPFYKTQKLLELGSRATHLHIHGYDHIVLSRETIRGVQIGMVDRLLRNAPVNTGTVEHNKGLCTKEDVLKTIKNFENMFR